MDGALTESTISKVIGSDVGVLVEIDVQLIEIVQKLGTGPATARA